MLWNLVNLLTDTTETTKKTTPDWVTWVVLGVGALLIIGLMILSRRNQKKKQDETNAMLDAIAPGNRVKTIGGICGIVVEVCKEDNTFILETGSEASGKSYLKFDKQSVYQTDAKVPTQVAKEEKKEEAPVEAPVQEEAPVKEEAPVEAPAKEEAPVEEKTEEKAE